MFKKIYSFLILVGIAGLAYGGLVYNPQINNGFDMIQTVEEEDGNPSVPLATIIKVPNDSLTDNADGTLSLSFGSAETDPIASAINGILKSDGTTLSAATAGTDYYLLGETSTTAYRGDRGKTAYSHSQDNTQAHSDYLLNNASDTTTGNLTAARLFTSTSSSSNAGLVITGSRPNAEFSMVTSSYGGYAFDLIRPYVTGTGDPAIEKTKIGAVGIYGTTSGGSLSNSYLYLDPTSSGAYNNATLKIDSDGTLGEVGIGLSSSNRPTAALDVYGTFKVTESGVATGTGFTIGAAAITEAELEILDGATLSTSDINIIDGISDSGTLTAAELLYVDGVTSAIQTQLNAKEGTLTNEAGLYAVLSDVSQFYEAGDEDTIAGLFSAGAYANDSIQAADIDTINAGRSLTWDTTNDEMDADAELYTDTKCIYIENPTADDDLKSIFRNCSATDYTITEIWAESDQTVNFDLQIDDGSPADVNGTDISPAAGEAEDTSLSGDTTLGTNEELDLSITSVSGTPTWCSICWTYTKGD